MLHLNVARSEDRAVFRSAIYNQQF